MADVPEKKNESFFARNLSRLKKFGDIGWKFSKELWKDHQFLVDSYAVKGGAAVAVLGGAFMALSFAFTYPFIMTAGIILLCGTAMTLGGIGVVAGCSQLWERLKDTYYKATGKERPPTPAEKKKNIIARFKEKPLVQKAVNHRYAQKFFASRTWKTVKKMKDKQEELLNSLAIGGSVASTGFGVWLLAAQIMALPVVALPMLLTVAVVTSATYIVSGGLGLWISVKNVFDKRRVKKEAAAAAAAEKSVPAPSSPAQGQDLPLLPPPLKKDFDAAKDAALPANDDAKAAHLCKPPKAG